MINRDVLDMKLQDQLQTDVGIQVGMSDVPDAEPTVPYAILDWSPSPKPEGSLANNEDMPYFDYAVKSVGRDARETGRTSSRIRRSLRSRKPVLDNEVIISISTISLGVIAPSNGPNLFEVNDIYRICLQDSAP